MRWVYDDGGRDAAGYHSIAGDCVCRALAIALRKPYSLMHDKLAAICQSRLSAPYRMSHPETSIKGAVFQPFLKALGWRYTCNRKHKCPWEAALPNTPGSYLLLLADKPYRQMVEGDLLHLVAATLDSDGWTLRDTWPSLTDMPRLCGWYHKPATI